MIEAALVFDREGKTLHWHLPPGRSAASIPDSRDLWQLIWERRDELGGVAHSHPWSGAAAPSNTDLTTWSACERALGVRLVWPIVTLSDAGFFTWQGPGELDYARQPEPTLQLDDLDQLRSISSEEES